MKDTGIVYICNLTNISNNGAMPFNALEKVSRHWFEARTIGLNRQYQAKGVSEQVDMLIRIPHDESVRIGQFAMLGDGSQFRITNATVVISDTDLLQTEITLQRLDRLYDVRANI